MVLELKDKLLFLINSTFEKLDISVINSYSNFKITLSKKHLKRNEQYKSREMIICNLYRSEASLVNSLIICLAHHIDYCNRGETKKDKDFFAIYERILTIALNLNMLNYDELNNTSEAKSQGYIKDVLSTYWQNNYHSEKSVIEVYDCYDIKDALKKSNYKYNANYLCWEKEIDTNEMIANKARIQKLKPSAKIKIRDVNHVIFVMDAFIVVEGGNTFYFRDELKKNKFYFKDKKWIKRIKANMYLSEKRNIENILPAGQGIKISLDY